MPPATVLSRRGARGPPSRPERKECPLLLPGTALFAIYESATALERAEASARVLAARASGYAGAPRAFAELAEIAPEGLIPTPGRGAAHVARQIERAANVGALARPLLGDEVIEALEWAAEMTRRVAATSDALDPAGAARAARRGVATVRGLIGGTVDRDERWDTFRLGTYLPRAGWVSALVQSASVVARRGDSEHAWRVAAAITGLDPNCGDVSVALLSDRGAVMTSAFAIAEVESALLALHRRGCVGPASLPLAREVQTRLRDTTSFDTSDDPDHDFDRLLDGIGALAESIVPRPAEPAMPPVRGLRRALPASGSPTMA